jgi:hypothetical protein
VALPKHNLGLGYKLEGWIFLKLVELLLCIYIFLLFVFKIFWILLINRVVELFLPHMFTQVSWKYSDYFLLFWGFKVALL